MSVLAPSLTPLLSTTAYRIIETTHHNAATANANGTILSLATSEYPIASVSLHVRCLSGDGGGVIYPEARGAGAFGTYTRMRAWDHHNNQWVTEIPSSASARIYTVPVANVEQFIARLAGYTSGEWTVMSWASTVPFVAPETLDDYISQITALDAITETTHHSAVTANANGTERVFDLTRPINTVTVGVTGTSGGATITAEIRGPDSNNWTAARAWDVANNQWVTELDGSANVLMYIIPVGQTSRFRVKIADYTAGTWTVKSWASSAPFVAPQNIEPHVASSALSLAAIQTAVEDSTTHHTPVGSHGTTVTLTSAVEIVPYLGATKLIMQAFGGAVRYRLDGVDPTASTGFRIAENEQVTIPLAAGATVRVIQESGAATVQYQAVA